jgi:Mrp family chromosome partitioning ATPase
MLVADPQVLLGLADGVLLVMIPGQTRKEVVRAVREQVQHSGVRLLGVVFNRLKHSRRSGYGAYSYYYYPYYYSSNYYDSNELEGNEAARKKGFWKRSSKKKP